MGEAAREAGEVVMLGSEPERERGDAARLSQVAEQCHALGVLISMLDLPAPEDDG